MSGTVLTEARLARRSCFSERVVVGRREEDDEFDGERGRVYRPCWRGCCPVPPISPDPLRGVAMPETCC